MKKLLVLVHLVFSVLMLQAQEVVPFVTRDVAPRLEVILPAPPDYGSILFQNDCARYQWGLSLRPTERGQQAREDAFISAEYFMTRFSPAVGRPLSPELQPKLYALMQRIHRTEWETNASVKEYFHRVRPYQLFGQPTLVPEAERPTDYTSYPSGHTMASWLEGMVLTAVYPEHTEAIMQVAYELGQSRVIAGFHYQSDVDAGRVAASIIFARLCAEPEFLEMLGEAKNEKK